MRFAAAVLIFAWLSDPARAEPIAIPAPVGPLGAVLMRPPGGGPFPAIVGLHGCSGLAAAGASLRKIYRDWGERWVAAGYAVLFPDSFSSRGAASQCRVRKRAIRPRLERAGDAAAARAWLQQQPWVDPDRVFAVGWSNGGQTALWAVHAGDARAAKQADFRAAIAFYPGCRTLAARGWTPRVPTLILIGAADDWTPLKPCRDLVDAQDGSKPVEIVVYPDAYHGFDAPDRPLRRYRGLAFTADGSGMAHSGSNPAARADAIRRVSEWLAR